MAKKAKSKRKAWKISEDPEWQGVVSRIEEKAEDQSSDALTFARTEARFWREEAEALFTELVAERAFKAAWKAVAEAEAEAEAEASRRLSQGSRKKPALRLVRRAH